MSFFRKVLPQQHTRGAWTHMKERKQILG